MATKLKNMKVTRVDLVDQGANQEAHIVITKAADPGYKPKPEPAPASAPSAPSAPAPQKAPGMADRISQMLGEKMGQGQGQDAPGAPSDKAPQNPLGRAPGNRIVHIRPSDFQVVSQDGSMMEWEIPADKLPEGVEAAELTMAAQNGTQVFQWMVDPIMGPPIEGTAKTAPEAFLAMRGALTQTGAMGGPEALLGGLPGAPAAGGAPAGAGSPSVGRLAGGGANGSMMGGMPKPRSAKVGGIAKRIAERKPVRAEPVAKGNPDTTLAETLDLIVKGLIQVDVFAETATGQDLADILPDDLLTEVRSKLSANQSAG